ncbi:alpha/beta hydrolase [Methanobacterium sp.]|uniref:alpha/beta fold hydrolase n=1 Tax=Methanobacterium sp. TaxID=2164 RepID=UPI0025FDA343|nr:alpha/beta hydrolase [Methanobacterium sp.]MBI5459229.1 alpha/beta hydrolase [Methanobacterium sp.]
MKILLPRNLNLNYLEFGVGNPVVLIHGMGSDHTVWEGLIPLLKEDYRVIAVDLCGHGLSSKNPGPYSIKLFAEDIYLFLESLNIDQAHFMGHSMGGVILQELAVKHPERFKSLTLISSFACIDTPLEEVLINLKDILIEEGYKAFFDECLKVANSPEFIRKNRELFSKIRDENSKICSVSSIVDTINACLDIKLCCDVNLADSIKEDTIKEDTIKDIRIPTLVIAGEKDVFTPTHHGMKIHESIPNSRMEIIEGGCHNLLVEKPVEICSVIKRFLDDL